MKTPEELAEEWIETNGWNTEPFRDEYTIEFQKQGYVAGYQAAKKKERLKLAELYSHGSDVQKIASAYFKSKGITGALLPYAENRFIDGYLAAQEHAHAALEEAEAEIDRLQTKLSDAGILTTEHLLGTDNSSNNSNGWISVKDRLPRALELVLYFHELHGPSIGYYDPACPKPGYQWISEEWGDNKTARITHWMPLPKPPEE